MTQEEFDNLQVGDVLTNCAGWPNMIVIAKEVDTITGKVTYQGIGTKSQHVHV